MWWETYEHSTVYNTRQMLSWWTKYDWQYPWTLYKIQNKTGVCKVYYNHHNLMDLIQLTIEHYTRYRTRPACVKYFIIITIWWTYRNSITAVFLKKLHETKQYSKKDKDMAARFHHMFIRCQLVNDSLISMWADPRYKLKKR
jgi:hypothetical protein